MPAQEKRFQREDGTAAQDARGQRFPEGAIEREQSPHQPVDFKQLQGVDDHQGQGSGPGGADQSPAGDQGKIQRQGDCQIGQGIVEGDPRIPGHVDQRSGSPGTGVIEGAGGENDHPRRTVAERLAEDQQNVLREDQDQQKQRQIEGQCPLGDDLVKPAQFRHLLPGVQLGKNRGSDMAQGSIGHVADIADAEDRRIDADITDDRKYPQDQGLETSPELVEQHRKKQRKGEAQHFPGWADGRRQRTAQGKEPVDKIEQQHDRQDGRDDIRCHHPQQPEAEGDRPHRQKELDQVKGDLPGVNLIFHTLEAGRHRRQGMRQGEKGNGQRRQAQRGGQIRGVE